VIKISTEKPVVLCLSGNPSRCTLQVSGNALEEEKFKYPVVALASEARRKKDIDSRISKTNAVLREIYRSVVTKSELSNAAKQSVLNWPVFRSSPMVTNVG